MKNSKSKKRDNKEYKKLIDGQADKIKWVIESMFSSVIIKTKEDRYETISKPFLDVYFVIHYVFCSLTDRQIYIIFLEIDAHRCEKSAQ